MSVWEKFRKNIIENKLIVSGDRIVLAVSGGADSVVMAHLFYRLSKVLRIKNIIVNFNHSLRKESVKEAEFVKNFADSCGIDCILKTFDTEKYAGQNNVSVETAGRQLRYITLEQVAAEYKCNKIATAHNMNDNAETVLMWLLRGTGPEGLTGIPNTRKINAKCEIIRPLLPVSRSSIEEYAKSQNLKFCTDKTNFACDYTRNKIRLRIIPELKQINSSVIEHIYSLSEILKKENSYFEKKVMQFIKKYVKRQNGKLVVDISAFKRAEDVLRFRILKELIPDKRRVLHIKNVMDFVFSSKARQYELSKLCTVKKTKKYFSFIMVK